MKDRRLIVATFDIETTDLSAHGAGWMTTFVIKPMHGEPVVLRWDDLNCQPGREKPLIAAVVKEMAKYDLVIGHNIGRFDLPFIKSRMRSFNLRWEKRPLYYDTLPGFGRTNLLTIRNMKGNPTKSLEMIIDFYHIKQKKTKLYPNVLWDAINGSPERFRRAAMDYIVDHCVKDVWMTERIIPLIMEDDPKPQLKRFD